MIICLVIFFYPQEPVILLLHSLSLLNKAVWKVKQVEMNQMQSRLAIQISHKADLKEPQLIKNALFFLTYQKEVSNIVSQSILSCFI